MAELTIRSLTARPVLAPLARPLRTAAGEIPQAPLVLVDIHSEEGITGRAYVFAYTASTLQAMTAFLEEVAAMLAGRPVAPVEQDAAFAARFRLLGRQGLVGMALSGVDMALWDALAKAQDLPLAAMLGGRPRPLPAYDSYGLVDPRADEKALRASVDRGFRAVKIKLGDGGLGRDVDTVAAVRDIIGPDVALMVDYNQSLSAPEAIRRTRALESYDPIWVEEPVPAEDLVGHARVREAVAVPLQTGENWWFVQDMARALERDACDLAMLDVMKIGGVTGWMRTTGLAETASLPVSSHTFPETSAHLLAVTPTAHWLEYLDVAGPLLREPPAIEDGCLAPHGPGLGLAWDEDAVARYRL